MTRAGQLAAIVAIAMATVGAAPAPPHPVLVELFTSQGCSSCPPADALLTRLAADRRVVAITRPVTYWDALGWKDTLARPANTNLQRAYAARKFAGGGVYTPQMVVQGRAGAVGGNERNVRTLIARAGGLAEPAIRVERAANGGHTVLLSGKGAADVVVVAMRGAVDVAIGRGENSGRRIRYANVLVAETTVGRWSGGVGRVAIPAGALRVAGADRYAVVVRTGDAGPVLAARYL